MTYTDDHPFDVSDPFEFGKRGDRARGRGARARSGIDDWNSVPVATVFGAGVAGLTAAHELVERGFYVQVVEPEECQEDENACEVGGLARSQPARFRQFRLTHRDLDEQDRDWQLLVLLRDRKLQRVQRRFGFPERISLPPPMMPWPAEVSGSLLDSASRMNETANVRKRRLLLWAFAGLQTSNADEQLAELVALLDPYTRDEPARVEREARDAWARIYRMAARLLKALVHYRRDLAGELELLSRRDSRTYKFDKTLRTTAPDVARRGGGAVRIF